MPYISNSTYRPKVIFQNGHISTIYAGVIKRLDAPNYLRTKLHLPDNDFLLLDYLLQDPNKALIICHGLEGDSRKNYNNACANYFIEKGYSVFAWNNRSCGGEMNLLPQLYHHASVEDLEYVIEHVVSKGFLKVFLVGFSLGGDQILNYLGRNKVSEQVKAAVAISTPFNLQSSAEKIQEGIGRIYLSRFIRKIRAKISIKVKQFPDIVPLNAANSIKSFEDIVSKFIVPVHGGFSDLDDYYEKASPIYSIDGIEIPVLVMNAWDDPILGKDDHPIEMAKQHDYVFLETPDHGGHCAFPLKVSNNTYSVVRAFEFIEGATDNSF